MFEPWHISYELIAEKWCASEPQILRRTIFTSWIPSLGPIVLNKFSQSVTQKRSDNLVGGGMVLFYLRYRINQYFRIIIKFEILESVGIHFTQNDWTWDIYANWVSKTIVDLNILAANDLNLLMLKKKLKESKISAYFLSSPKIRN